MPARLPLRTQLVGLLVVLVTGALVVSGAATTAVLRGRLLDRVDDQLRTSAEGVAREAVRGAFGGGRGGPDGGPRVPTQYVVQVALAGEGTQLIAPPDTASPDDLPVIPALDVREAQQQGGRPFSVPSRDGGERWRVLALAVDGDTSGSVAVALPLADVDRTVRQARLLSLLVGGLVVAAAALLGWFAVRRSLRPLGNVERTAAAIAAGDLSRRVPEGDPGTEVGRLTTSLNRMLGQLEQSFRAREASTERMRRFVADASHELRTPLASIRGFAELHRSGALGTPEEVARGLRRIEDEARRMGGLVEDLLALARLDEQRPLRRDPVDLLVLAADAVQDARALAPERTFRLVGVDGGPPVPTTVTGDEDRLRQVLANLLGNAVRHTPAGSPVEVAVGTATGVNGLAAALVEVRDHGPGVPPQDRERVFERFFRTDASRTRASGGSGLGLSIVAAVAAAHQGSVDVVETPGGGATFRLALPPAASGGGGPSGTAADSQPAPSVG